MLFLKTDNQYHQISTLTQVDYEVTRLNVIKGTTCMDKAKRKQIHKIKPDTSMHASPIQKVEII